MCRVRTTGHLHKPKLFNFKLDLMRLNDHKNGTPSEARMPWLVHVYVRCCKKRTTFLKIVISTFPAQK